MGSLNFNHLNNKLYTIYKLKRVNMVIITNVEEQAKRLRVGLDSSL